MPTKTQSPRPEEDTKLKTLLADLDLLEPKNRDYLEIKASNEVENLGFEILNSQGEILDYLETPIVTEVLWRKMEFWSLPLREETFIDRSCIDKLVKDIGIDATRRIFDSFVSTSTHQFATIKKALDEKDFFLLRNSTHKLKTSAGIVGAIYLYKFCQLAVEKATRKEPWTSSFSSKFHELESLFLKCFKNFRP